MPLRLSEPDPAPAVFAHCRELVCTDTDLPECQFTQVTNSLGSTPQSEEIECRRDADHLACDSHSRALSGSDEQQLKFNCMGDPLECELPDGNAAWAVSGDSGAPQRRSCHREPSPGAPSSPALPSADTA